jgi:hypothetical protein
MCIPYIPPPFKCNQQPNWYPYVHIKSFLLRVAVLTKVKNPKTEDTTQKKNNGFSNSSNPFVALVRRKKIQSPNISAAEERRTFMAGIHVRRKARTLADLSLSSVLTGKSSSTRPSPKSKLMCSDVCYCEPCYLLKKYVCCGLSVKVIEV